MTWKKFQIKNIKRVIKTMFKQLKKQHDILQENKNKEMK